MATILYCDVSSFQGIIDWQKYAVWARSVDGIARVAVKATEGVGFTDPRFATNRAGAMAAGVDVIIYYAYGRPDLGNSAASEADWLWHSLGSSVRANDVLMLDLEVSDPRATAEWAYEWLTQQEQNYGRPPIIYASDAYIRARLQDPRLAKYPLALANWTYSPNARPPCPPPWSTYTYLQYTDKATAIPGIAGAVDADIYLGHEGDSMNSIPTGWHDDGTTLTALNGVPVVLGFRAHILNAPSWDAGNQPQEAEYHTDQVLLHNAAIGAGQRQCFRDGMLWYTTAKGVVWESYLGLELDAAYRQIATLQAQIPPVSQPVPAPPAANVAQAINDLEGLTNTLSPMFAKILADSGKQ